jgi:hypothetical protein
VRRIDLGSTGTKAAELRNVSTDDIMRELLRRDCVDFSQVSLHMRLSFLYLVLALLVAYQVRRLMGGYNPLECFL